MKKKHLLVAAAMVGCMVIGAAAAGGVRSVTAQLRPDFTLEVNGSVYTLRDSKGNVTDPLLYNDTTYLPIRSVGEILGAEVSWDSATQTVIIKDQDTAAGLIGEEKAKELALKHAGLSASRVTFLQVKLDWEDGYRIYDVEFYRGNKEYDYHVDAKTGAIRSYDHEIEDNTSSGTATAAITQAKAKEIALKHAGLSASQVTFITAKLDWEDGRQVYEVEFYSGNREYDYEIDAATGEIRSYDYDVENFSIPSSGSSGNYISRDRAIQLAQNRAPGATLVKIELDYDDGRAVYEGELRDGRTEYEFEIDAVTGDVIKWETDWDD